LIFDFDNFFKITRTVNTTVYTIFWMSRIATASFFLSPFQLQFIIDLFKQLEIQQEKPFGNFAVYSAVISSNKQCRMQMSRPQVLVLLPYKNTQKILS